MEKIKQLEKKINLTSEPKAKIALLRKLHLLYKEKGKLYQAKEYLREAYNIVLKVGLANISSLVYVEITYELGHICLHDLQEYSDALKYFLISYKKSKELQNIDHQVRNLTSIGYVNRIQGEYSKADKYFDKAIELGLENNSNKMELVFAYNEKANACFFLEQYKKSILLHEKALKIAQDKNYYNLEGFILHDMALANAEIGNLKKAENELEKCQAAFEKVISGKPIFIYNSLGNLYIHKQDYNKALINYQKTLEFTDINKGTKLEAYQGLTKVYAKLKDFKKAYKYLKKAEKLRSIIYNENSKKKIAEMQTKFDYETQKKEAEIYRLKNIELKKANAAKDRFFSIIAHDLKSPFSTIISFINIMKKSFGRYDKNRILNLVKELEESTHNTFNLLKNLLDWSRMQSGVINFKPTQFDINEIIDEVCTLKEPKAKQKNIKLSLQIEGENSTFGDVNMVTTIIRNLVNNAIKFTHSGGKIIIKSNQNNEKTVVEISDNGIGIKKENLSKLFRIESNFSTYGTANEKGTGLGLILVKEFIEKNNGSIEVKSEYGEGSTFKFSLPAQP